MDGFGNLNEDWVDLSSLPHSVQIYLQAKADSRALTPRPGFIRSAELLQLAGWTSDASGPEPTTAVKEEPALDFDDDEDQLRPQQSKRSTHRFTRSVANPSQINLMRSTLDNAQGLSALYSRLFIAVTVLVVLLAGSFFMSVMAIYLTTQSELSGTSNMMISKENGLPVATHGKFVEYKPNCTFEGLSQLKQFTMPLGKGYPAIYTVTSVEDLRCPSPGHVYCNDNGHLYVLHANGQTFYARNYAPEVVHELGSIVKDQIFYGRLTDQQFLKSAYKRTIEDINMSDLVKMYVHGQPPTVNPSTKHQPTSNDEGQMLKVKSASESDTEAASGGATRHLTQSANHFLDYKLEFHPDYCTTDDDNSFFNHDDQPCSCRAYVADINSGTGYREYNWFGQAISSISDCIRIDIEDDEYSAHWGSWSAGANTFPDYKAYWVNYQGQPCGANHDGSWADGCNEYSVWSSGRAECGQPCIHGTRMAGEVANQFMCPCMSYGVVQVGAWQDYYHEPPPAEEEYGLVDAAMDVFIYWGTLW
mmetsp:Transcript_14028/g.17000  ORF Transcript_14028/g.17000 Transcript_14028/m.17000 type:complete len:531 (+) Transcript_14028:166-1758(+)|eukprot:CAMPEP_0197850676 /NCGR_PEP_ID=MMETSP1438-20131217/16058_1 /TAXON_ID=1461541 /ORGANISM="Pterosperma sp., Strain CCMP1384" /LENGTH=530 /DNA_ID=CAMNT_0043463965 /DNA_START=153 /DNA_END=1745 /DNA_ORIENTATION=+